VLEMKGWFHVFDY